VDTQGYIDLYTMSGEEKHLSGTIKIRYLKFKGNISYIILLGRHSLNIVQAIVSTLILAMKFSSTSGDIVTMHVDQKVARECFMVSLRVEPTNRAQY